MVFYWDYDDRFKQSANGRWTPVTVTSEISQRVKGFILASSEYRESVY